MLFQVPKCLKVMEASVLYSESPFTFGFWFSSSTQQFTFENPANVTSLTDSNLLSFVGYFIVEIRRIKARKFEISYFFFNVVKICSQCF